MSLVRTAAAVVLDAALGVWLGSIVFFSLVAAPTIFDVLDGDDANAASGDSERSAGKVVNAIFPKYYVFGELMGWLALGASFVVETGGPLDGTLVTLVVLVGVALNLYARGVLVPKMDEAGDDSFATYHGRSVALNGVTMLAVAVGLVLSQL